MPERSAFPGFVIAACGTGSGKTTLALALLAALKRRGLSPRPFKIGPDPLDSGLHAAMVTPAASPRIPNPGRNLDGWLYGKENCLAIFARGMSASPGNAAPIAVVEGAMGLFDGADPVEETGSSAQMAKWLRLPVLLVLNAQGAGRTMAALVRGLTNFDPTLTFAGIVCNNVSSERHAAALTRSLSGLCPALPLLGCLPRDSRIALTSRHLGLHAAHEGILSPDLLDALVSWAETHMDIDRLLSGLAIPTGPLPVQPVPAAEDEAPCVVLRNSPPLRLGVSCDEALFFLAEDNLHRLRGAGAELVFFSPLHDAALPPNLDGLYLCGGYPELYADVLSRNNGMLTAMRDFAASKRPFWAAGGGFLCLLESFAVPAPDGTASFCTPYPMAGVFPGRARLENRLQALGYRDIALNADSMFGPAGTSLRANEFRYSRFSVSPADCPTLFAAYDKEGRDIGPEGFYLPDNPNIIGTFLHIHLASSPNAARHFVTRMAQEREGHA